MFSGCFLGLLYNIHEHSFCKLVNLFTPVCVNWNLPSLNVDVSVGNKGIIRIWPVCRDILFSLQSWKSYYLENTSWFADHYTFMYNMFITYRSCCLIRGEALFAPNTHYFIFPENTQIYWNDSLTLSMLVKTFSRRHFEIFFPENRIWHFMQIVS